ncbi:DUF1156 domain-containing protein, partial [Natrialba chahannaoensis]|uniref:DUF1156 domain-containing protein n=1 Tax=Natrialba chahannaoensis TaxID=68911 RepID=UPI001268626D
MTEKTTGEQEISVAPDKVAIEGKLPLAAIDIESQKDMGSGGCHPLLSLHKWFAARPTPVSRAAVLGSVIPGDVDHDEFLKLMQIGPKGMQDGISEHLQKKFSETKSGSYENHYECVIESVTYEAAGCAKCVQHKRNPARRSF